MHLQEHFLGEEESRFACFVWFRPFFFRRTLIQNLIVNVNLCHTLGFSRLLPLSPVKKSESWSIMKITNRQNSMQNEGCHVCWLIANAWKNMYCPQKTTSFLSSLRNVHRESLLFQLLQLHHRSIHASSSAKKPILSRPFPRTPRLENWSPS